MSQGDFPPNPYEGPQPTGQQQPPSAASPPPGAPAGAPSQYAAPAQTSGMAVAALILGIVGMLAGPAGVIFSIFACCFDIPAVIAIILGFVARTQIKQSNGRQVGMGMATTGAVLGIVSIGLQLLLFAILMIFFAAAKANHP